MQIFRLIAVVGLGMMSGIFVILAIAMLYGHYWSLSLGSLAMAINLFPSIPLPWQGRVVISIVLGLVM